MYKYRKNSFKLKKTDISKLFASLSLTVGGNSQEITRAQLKIYIRRAEKGKVFPTAKLLNAFIKLDKSWDVVFGEKFKINEHDFLKTSSFFSNTIENDSFDYSSNTPIDFNEEDSATINYLKNLSEKINGSSEVLASAKQIKNYLSKLIDDSSDENDNADEIALITNILASKKESDIEFNV